MKADYHFHPNLLAKNPEKRLQAIWKAFERNQMGAVICTEHSFKNAPLAYRLLKAYRPNGATTHLFPGAELATGDKPGIDVIVFAEHDWYDRHPKLLEPFSMKLLDMIAYLEQTDLQWFIPHPCLLHSSLKHLYKNPQEMNVFLKTLPAVEAFNACFLPIEHLCSCSPFNLLFPRFRDHLRHCAHPGVEHLAHTHYRFLAVGSDAHHPRDIGFGVEIPCRSTSNRGEAFHALTHNTDVRHLHFPHDPLSLLRILHITWTTFTEGWTKKEWQRYDCLHRAFHLSIG